VPIVRPTRAAGPTASLRPNPSPGGVFTHIHPLRKPHAHRHSTPTLAHEEARTSGPLQAGSCKTRMHVEFRFPAAQKALSWDAILSEAAGPGDDAY